ncbi:MAG: hypothetical protein KDE56_10805 [Anaerolineales bacterium]|nr:hypothetical protein [Anaerolineales bacterium]
MNKKPRGGNGWRGFLDDGGLWVNGRLVINTAAAVFVFYVARGDNGDHDEDKENDKDYST